MRVQCALCPEWDADAEDADAARQVFADHRFEVHGIPPPARSDFAVCEECGWMAEVFGHPRQRPHKVREVLAAHVCPHKQTAA